MFIIIKKMSGRERVILKQVEMDNFRSYGGLNNVIKLEPVRHSHFRESTGYLDQMALANPTSSLLISLSLGAIPAVPIVSRNS